MAVLCSLLLGSCTSTNDPNLDFGAPGFNAQSTAAHPATETAAGVAAPATAETAQTTDVAGTALATVMDDSDQPLPVAVAYLPTARPALSGTGTISLQQAVEAEAAAARLAAAAQQPAEQPAVLAQAPVSAAKPVETQAEAAPAQPVQVASAAEMNNPVYVTAGEPQNAAPESPKKKGFLASLFGASSASSSASPAASSRGAPTTAIAKPLVASAAPGLPAAKPLIEATAAPTPVEPEAPAKPLIQLASAESTAKPASLVASTGSDIGLPGVRQTALFEIRRKSGIDDDSDVDLHEEEDGGPVQVASAAGMARLAPNGLLRQSENVDVACLKPSLVRMLKTIEQHYSGKIVVTSGYRSPSHNRRARGAKNSLHMYCAAADIQIEGVSKWELANYVRTMPGRGGVGTYCHTDSVHVDVGPERDWNWRCRRRK
ncbi:peptidase M15A [Mesorhizobium soli]|uniref:Peptidase M15A n=1 Tax=Pseudaminobacter soli (ex Li et al. 2025) TaxID=1295366 RepID=A0A2P7SBV6_9HYPH|nr:peptidase M15A [Mesorhizobium soli]